MEKLSTLEPSKIMSEDEAIVELVFRDGRRPWWRAWRFRSRGITDPRIQGVRAAGRRSLVTVRCDYRGEETVRGARAFGLNPKLRGWNLAGLGDRLGDTVVGVDVGRTLELPKDVSDSSWGEGGRRYASDPCRWPSRRLWPLHWDLGRYGAHPSNCCYY